MAVPRGSAPAWPFILPASRQILTPGELRELYPTLGVLVSTLHGRTESGGSADLGSLP